MASLLGSHVPIDCPVCPEQVEIPLHQLDVSNGVVTVSLDFAPLHEHVAAGHKTSEEAS
jgi:hypothetical protein